MVWFHSAVPGAVSKGIGGIVGHGPRLDIKLSLLRQVERAQDMVLDGLSVLTVDTINPWTDSQ